MSVKKIYKLTAKTFHGLEKILASEIKKVGGKDIKIIKRAVKFTGDNETLYKANYLIRTAINILWEIKTFTAKTENELYENALNIEWENYINVHETFAVDKTVNSALHKHSHYAALKTKDAVADYFVNNFNKRPSVDTKDPDKLIHLHITGDKCTISLDTSGEALFKRKYRQKTDIAPLNEILAAGLVLLSDFKNIEYFYDPMCGSGTILIEAAMIFMNIPPAYLRKKFAFQKFADYDYKLWHAVKREADKNINKNIPVKIIGTDISEHATEIAQKNISNAGLRHSVKIYTKDFINTRFENKTGLIISNPPYDVRIKSENISQLYREIGNTLKKGYNDWSAYIFSGNLNALKNIRLKSDQDFTLYNGKIKCKYSKFNIF